MNNIDAEKLEQATLSLEMLKEDILDLSHKNTILSPALASIHAIKQRLDMLAEQEDL